MNRLRDLGMVLVAVSLAIAACSLPTDDEATLIDPEALPDALRSDLEVTTTIEQGPRTEPVQIFLLRPGEGDFTRVVEVGREIDPQASFEQEITLLFGNEIGAEIRTAEEIEEGWFNALTDFQLLEAFVNENRVAIIDMVAVDERGEPIDVEAAVLKDAIAQLVYTATGLPEADPIEAVRIRIAGEARILPTDGEDTDAVLRRSDYRTYDPEFEPPPTTAPPTTTAPDPADVNNDG